MRVLASIILFLASLNAYSVCMTELDGDAYGCSPMHADKDALKWCSDKHGEKYRPYVTDNVCSKELAATLRGESYTTRPSDATAMVEAACMTYEQGMDSGCEFYNYEAARRYCSSNFGNRYIPFIPDNGKCSLDRASELRGEVSSERLVEGLASPIDEIETIMTMIDREGLHNPLGGFEPKKPKIGNEFYTDVVKALMAKMNSFNERLYSNGQLNISLQNKHTVTYLTYAFRYLNVLSRLFRVYAHVAHENHFVLKTYTFENLEYLNLKLKKEHALEILAKVNYRAKTVNNGKEIEFIVGQQERQTFEYMAMQDPATKKDYAKLITFLGVRENLTNLWGVQRMSPDLIQNDRTRSCGNFLSFRPGAGGMMEKSEGYKELFEYDAFYNDYVPRWEELVTKSLDVSILTERSAMDMGDYILRNVSELKNLLQNELMEPIESRQGFMDQAAKDAPMLIEAENSHWMEFSYNHFSTVVMPGDDVLERSAILERIIEEAYQKRLDAIVDIFVAAYLWVSDEAVAEMENKIRWFSDKYLRASFERRLKAKLSSPLRGYNSMEKLAKENREQKEKETYEAAKKAVVAVNVLNAIKNESLNYGKMNTLEPSSMEELMMLFQDRVERDFFDLKQTLEHNEKLAMVLSSFFKEISTEFQARFMTVGNNGQKALGGTKIERVKGLREIAFNVAKRWHSVYPYVIADHKLRAYPVLVQNGQNSIPVYPDGTPAAMSRTDFFAGLPTGQDAAIANTYVAKKRDTTAYFGATKPLSHSRRNADKVTTGEIGRPLEIVSPGRIKTDRGEAEINNSKLVELFKSFSVLSKQAKEALSARAENTPAASPVGKYLAITHPGKFMFRVLEALRLEDVGMRKHVSGRFARDEQAQALLANNLVSQAYQTAPILRNELVWQKKVVKYCAYQPGHMARCDQYKEVSLPLLEKIASEAYDRSTNIIDSSEAKGFISTAIDNAIKNTPNKLSKFCDVNYLNYVNDSNFKDAFKASKFLRASLRSGVGQSEAVLEKLNRFDANIKKEIRGRWEAWNEDFFEPSLHVLGYAALVALGVVAIMASGGLATPGVMGGVYAVASTFLAIEFFVSFPLVVGSLYARINTNFIEVPAQLKFQQSLATSQVDFSKVVDWDMLAADKKENKSQKAWTIGLMPLDFLYGAMLGRHVQVQFGSVGRAAYTRLTGAKLRGWSAPPRNMMSNPRFSELRKKIGLRGAVKAKYGHQVNRIKSFLPKYQAVPENMIRSTALRMGIVRTANRLQIGNKPWAILKDVTQHSDKLKGRLKEFRSYVQAESQVVEKVRMKGMLRPGEILKHFNKTSIWFVPATLAKRVKALDGKGVARFFTNFGEVWDELKTAQGAIIQQRVKNIDEVAKKLEDFRQGASSGYYKGDDLTRQFIDTLSDNQILALEEVAKKSNGLFRNFKTVFKDYERVVQGLKPMSYLSAYGGREFGKPVYSQTYTLDGQFNSKYAFESDAEDLVNFYESMMRNNGVKTTEMNELRENVEHALTRKIKNENGKFSEL